MFWDTVTPHDTKDVLQAAHVECVEPFFSPPRVESPRLTAIQECGKNTGTAFWHLGAGGESVQLCNKHA